MFFWPVWTKFIPELTGGMGVEPDFRIFSSTGIGIESVDLKLVDNQSFSSS